MEGPRKGLSLWQSIKNINTNNGTNDDEVPVDPLALVAEALIGTLPNVEPRGYFGPIN